MKTSIAILVIKKQHVIFKQDGGAGDMVKKKKFEAPNEVMISALKTVSNKYCNYIHIYISTYIIPITFTTKEPQEECVGYRIFTFETWHSIQSGTYYHKSVSKNN